MPIKNFFNREVCVKEMFCWWIFFPSWMY